MSKYIDFASNGRANQRMLTLDAVYQFGALLVHLCLHGVNYNASNRKENAALALAQGLLWLEVSVYPENFAEGDGSVKKAELEACDLRCAHNALNAPSTGAGRCYVNASLIRGWWRTALKHREQGVKLSLPENGFILRLTRWGDISRLNDEGLEFIADLCDLSAETRAYSNLWRDDQPSIVTENFYRSVSIARLREVCQASVHSVDEALDASRRGWKVYAGANQQDIRNALNKNGFGPVYKCPYTDHLGKHFCSNCALKCNGTKQTLSPF